MLYTFRELSSHTSYSLASWSRLNKALTPIESPSNGLHSLINSVDIYCRENDTSHVI